MTTIPPKPWLSVLMPTYNGEKYLPATLDSIRAQKDPNIECIVIDDGSTDQTIAILERAMNTIPIRVYRSSHKGNWVANTNKAISLAKGDYICFLHQDDIWFDERLKILKWLIHKHPSVFFFLHPSQYLDNNGNFMGIWQCPLPKYPEIIRPELIIEKLLIQNFIAIPAPTFKREIVYQIEGLDEKLWYTADWDFWLKIANFGDALYYPKPLSGFRIHPKSQTMVRSQYAYEFRKQLEDVYDKHLALWKAPDYHKLKIDKVARFSIEVNTTLAGSIHQKKNFYMKLITSFLHLGIFGEYRYLRDSRIHERVLARLRANLKHHK